MWGHDEMAEPSMPDWIGPVSTLIGGGALASLFHWLRDRRRARLDADVALQETIDRRVRLILEDDEKTIQRQREELEGMRVQLGRLVAYVATLVGLMRSAGIPVPPEPPFR